MLVGGKKHLGRGCGAGGNVVKQVGLARKRQADGLGQVLYQGRCAREALAWGNARNQAAISDGPERLRRDARLARLLLIS